MTFHNSGADRGVGPPPLSDEQQCLIRDAVDGTSFKHRKMFVAGVMDRLTRQASPVITNRQVIEAIGAMRRQWGAAR